MAEKRSETSTYDGSTQPVVDLLTQILNEFKKQVQSTTPPPLGDAADRAVQAFKEISQALDVKAASNTRKSQ